MTTIRPRTQACAWRTHAWREREPRPPTVATVAGWTPARLDAPISIVQDTSIEYVHDKDAEKAARELETNLVMIFAGLTHLLVP